MSYNFRIPEEDPICECRWDEVRQRMDRDDCHFHCDLPDNLVELDSLGKESHPIEIDEMGRLEGKQRSTEDEIKAKRKPAYTHRRQERAG